MVKTVKKDIASKFDMINGVDIGKGKKTMPIKAIPMPKCKNKPKK